MADSIRGSIQTQTADSQVPSFYSNSESDSILIIRELLCVKFELVTLALFDIAGIDCMS